MKLLQKVGLDYSLLSGVDWIYCAVKNVSYIELFEENLFTYKCSLSWITLVRFVFELLKRNMVKFWWIVVFMLSFIRCNFHSYLCCVVVWFVCLVCRKAAVGVYLHVVIPVIHVVITTGSSRKNDKSNPVFRGTNFNKSSVFSAVLDQELAANSSFRAPRSITITRWHP